MTRDVLLKNWSLMDDYNIMVDVFVQRDVFVCVAHKRSKQREERISALAELRLD